VKNFKIKSYCKVNLSLKIRKKLKNGYHNISTLITFCDLYDLISISKINKSKDKISFSGKFCKGIDKKSNTVTEVLKLLRKKKLLKNQSFKINIKKNIPHGSGLGGASSNASNLLNYFNNKMKFKLKKNKMIDLAKQIGFDVPICLEKKNTFLTGKKDKIIRVNNKFNLNLLIVYPNIICSTRNIYKRNRIKNSTGNEYYYNTKNNIKLMHRLKNEKNDLEYIKDLTSKDNRIKLIINELNMGVGLSRNEALKIFKGEYVAFLDSDDICLTSYADKKGKYQAQKKITVSKID